jgi:RHS repeat-associated protein
LHEWFSYSSRGELTDIYQQLTPHSSPSYYKVSQTYWPHGAPFQLSGSIGLPTIQYGGTIGSTVGLDGEGRITQVSASSGQNPVTGVSFNGASLPTQVNFGSGDSDIFAYDAYTLRMNQYQFKVNGQSDTGTLTWNANSTLQKLVIADAFNSANNQTCNYGYDDIKRLTSANCGAAAAQTFSYDAFGNINKSGSPYSFQPGYSSATNRMTSLPGNFTPTYDNNGNVTNDSNHTYAWDAAGNSITIDGVGLTFDALDRAVEKNNSGTYTEIVYAPTGAKLALMGGTNGQTLQKGFVSLAGRASAIYTGSGLSYYRHSDWLGSSRLSSTATAAAGTPGTGSATVSGSEQSIGGTPGTPGTGSVTFNGTLQSKQVQTQPATPGSGSITISGSEQSKTITYSCGPNGQTCTTVVYDTGTVTVTVNGEAKSANWGANDSPATISANLASALTGGSYVNATASGGVVTLTAKTSGSTTNYSLSVSVVGTNTQFRQPSFAATPSGSSLTGGADAVYATRYDSGSSTISVNGHVNTVSWSGSATTTPSIASALASSINSDSVASVTASASGSTVSLTAKGTGASTNYSLSSSWTYDSAYFSSSSFTSTTSGSSLAGGSNGTATIYDSGNVWVTVNGTQYSASYGQGSTANTVASAVANAVNGGSAPVTASASGATISLTAKTTGANTNYSLASGSSTSQPSNFSQPSFTVSVSGASLTGGTGGGTTMYADTAYAPFGEPYAPAGASDLSFTGQNQDTVSGDYDFLYREYSTQGRWPSPDPAGLGAVDPANPQSWNRYAYVLGDPLDLIDPTGDDGISGACASYLANGWTPALPCSAGGGSYGGGGIFIGIGAGGAGGDGGTTPIPPPNNPGTTFPGNPAGQIVCVNIGQNPVCVNTSNPNWFWTLMNAFWEHVPWAGAAFVPIPHTGGMVSVEIPFAYLPSSKTGCLGVGLAATTPTGKFVAGGPLTMGNLKKAQDILSSWGYSFGAQATPLIGVQAITNSSGTLGGGTLATETGLSAGFTWSKCGPIN